MLALPNGHGAVKNNGLNICSSKLLLGLRLLAWLANNADETKVEAVGKSASHELTPSVQSNQNPMR